MCHSRSLFLSSSYLRGSSQLAWVARNKLGHWSGLSQGKRLACTGLGLGLGSGLLPDFLGCEAGTGDYASIPVSGSLFGSDIIDPSW